MGSCAGCKGCGSSCASGPPATPVRDGRPRVIWDGDCTFCRRWVTRWRTLTGDTFAWVPAQDLQDRPDLDPATLASAVHLEQPDGTCTSGARAVAGILKIGGVSAWLARCMRVPGVAPVLEAAYALITRHRGGADRACRFALGRVEIPDTWQFTRRVVLRCMGLIYLVAFLSLEQQLAGLVGEDGLRPVGAFIETLRQQAPDVGLAQLPTMQWFGGDWLLTTTAVAGTVAAACMIAGLVPLVSAMVCWVCMLSLVTACSLFTGYQWDALLLEAGVLAMLWSPPVRHLGRAVDRPSRLIRWCFVLLLMKLMLLSGWVKLASHDPVWADGTALQYHFWTQPLPWWPAWFANLLPEGLLYTACELMLAVELWVPLLLVLPRVPRTIGALLLILLQLGIAATGNYGFFNWLTIVLCLCAIDDATLLLAWPRSVRHRFPVGLLPRRPAAVGLLTTCAGCALLVLSVGGLPQVQPHAPRVVQALTARAAPWHLTSNYGLFATMTTTRPELVVEASEDGAHWQPYVWRFAPGAVDQAPALSQPGMPRLDWQLWFDALGYERLHDAGMLRPDSAWRRFSSRHVLPNLLDHLELATPDVLDLLERAPLGETPPAFLRWSLWRATFTRSGSAWWSRELVFRSPLRASRRVGATTGATAPSH